MSAGGAGEGPVMVLGAGYAGVAVSHQVRRSGRGRIPLEVIDRHPGHTLRTRLYEVGRLAEAAGQTRRWSVPIDQVLAHDKATFLAGEVSRIDLDGRSVVVNGVSRPFRALAICLGSVAAYYGIPGAAENTEQVYRLAGALRLAERLRTLIQGSAATGRPARAVVVGGGSTGTELAAEIATAGWSHILRRKVPAPEVTLVVGAVPFLSGFPEPLVRHAQRLLDRSHVRLIPGVNVRRVEPGRLTLQDGSALEADVYVWCAGLEAPSLVRELPVPHGKGGRVKVDEHLEVPGHPGVFAVGDVMELSDPRTGLLVPGTAQAAMAEAPVAGRNLVAFLRQAPYASFSYRERGVVVSVGRGRGSGRIAGVSLWGRPAALVKAAVDREYATAASMGRESPGL